MGPIKSTWINWVRKNNKSIILRVNDRGPFAKDRIIDVSKKAASLLGFQKEGTTQVIVEYYGRANVYDYAGKINNKKTYKENKDNSKNYILNVGVFSDKKNIDKIKMKLKGIGKINIEKSKNDSSLYKVFLGPFGNKNFVYRVQNALSQKGLKDSVIEIIDWAF